MSYVGRFRELRVVPIGSPPVTLTDRVEKWSILSQRYRRTHMSEGVVKDPILDSWPLVLCPTYGTYIGTFRELSVVPIGSPPVTPTDFFRYCLFMTGRMCLVDDNPSREDPN